jgi:hypothetical protein
MQLNKRRAARMGMLLLLLLTLPAVVQAQFNYTTYNGTITITGYYGPGGAVTIPYTINGLPVTSIGDSAFVSCTSLTSVTIPASVTSIGFGAFNSCTSLTSVTIPASVTSIGDAAFAGCLSLAAITVDVLNPAYISVDGVLFNRSQTILIQCPGGKPGSYTIPNSVTTIGYGAFADCRSLTNLTIPSTVTSIGDWAFQLCTSLTSVAIPNSVTNMGNGAFYVCTSLTSITIGNGVTSTGDFAFAACYSLTNITVSTSVTSIGDFAFFNCTSLTSITIPTSVTNIGRVAFNGCTSLTAITVDALNPFYSSVDGVLFNKSQTTLIQYPGGKAGAYTIPNSVTSIGDSAFGSCTSLTSVTIPNSVTSIGDWAFNGCTSLTSVTIPNSVTSIGDYAFYDCQSLASVYFQGNAPSLGGSNVFTGDNNATVYYLAGTTGWGVTFGGRPTALWLPPAIQRSLQTQTAETNSTVALWVQANGSSPLCCLWYFNYTNFITWSTNWELELTNLQFSQLELTNVQFAQSGTYTVVVTNGAGAFTSSPAMLNVIAAVERRPVPGVKVTGQLGNLLNVDYANSLSPAPDWTTLGSISLISTSQYYFDLTLPPPPQRFYRAWQTGTPGVISSLDLHMVPAITLTGSIGRSVRVEYINQFGPTNAWVTLATVTLTNTSQLYFDVSAPGQPQRLYRLVMP